MASNFEDVSIIVDGLDECGTNTSEVVTLLVRLSFDQSSNTRSFFLSRDESEIRGPFSEEYNHLEIAARSEDLRLYVLAEIEARKYKFGREKLRIKSAELREHITKVLIEGAAGM